MQPCTAHSGRNASVTKLATLVSSTHGDGPPEPTTKAAAAAKHMQPCTAHSGRNASSEHGDGPSEPTTKAAAAAKHLQPYTARSGRNASVTKLVTPASSERAPRWPIRADDEGSGCSKALAQPCTAHSGRNASE
eukprot:scaffold15810_cov78-Phaeocystis_antarctica.AAC.1